MAVDALFFKPDIKVSVNGVQGFSKEILVDKKTFSSFQANIEYFIKFVRNNWDKVIRSGYVFQINPLCFGYKPIVIRIYPSSNGKANNKIISKLYEIKNILSNFRIIKEI